LYDEDVEVLYTVTELDCEDLYSDEIGNLDDAIALEVEGLYDADEGLLTATELEDDVLYREDVNVL
jgi:hypothetical protein